MLGALPHDSAHALFKAWASPGNALTPLALPYLAAAGDTTSLRAAARHLEAESIATSDSLSRALARYSAATARFFLALARHDTAGAVRHATAMPDSLCLEGCDLIRLARGRLLARLNQPDSAIALLTPAHRTLVFPLAPLFALEARVAERAGRGADALRDYRYVALVWRDADADLRDEVNEALGALQRLGGRDAPRARPVPRP